VSRIHIAIAALTIWLVFNPAAGPPASAAEPPWTEIYTQHFTVVSNAGPKRARDAAVRLEQMRTVFGSLLMRRRINIPEPLTVLALTRDKYAQALPAGQMGSIPPSGFLQPGGDQNYLVLNVSEEESWRAIAHDFAQVLLDGNYPPTQRWFDEGFAEYFSSIRLSDKQMEVGSDPGLEGNSAKPLSKILAAGAWLPLSEIFTMVPDAVRNQEDRNRFYAESWIVMHFLLTEQRLQEAGTYFDLVQNQKAPVDQAIAKAFGTSPAKLEQAVKAYFHSLTPGGSATTSEPAAPHTATAQLPAPVGPDDVGMTVTQVADADGQALLGDVMTRTPERREKGLTELRALAAEPANDETAHRALAWAEIEDKEFDSATEELAKAAELNARDRWVGYYLSVSKYRMAQSTGESIRGLANMMQDLRAVLDWYPEFAEAYNMLAMARLEGGGINSALEAIRQAIQLSPRNQQYVYNLGVVYASGKKWDAAREIFERLKSSSNPQLAAAARSQLQEMQFAQKYGIPMQRPPSGSAKSTPVKDGRRSEQQPSTGREPGAQGEEKSDIENTTAKAEQTVPTSGAIQFVKGKLVSVDCSQPPTAVLTVVSGSKTLKLRTSDFKSLTLIGADTFSCAWENRRVSINYRAKGKTGGDLVSVEVQ
jgi:tetratricopeptide (TPR) repeat protein